MPTKPKPKPPAPPAPPRKPREMFVLCSDVREFMGHVMYDTEAEAKRAARTLYNDPSLKPVKFVEQTK